MCWSANHGATLKSHVSASSSLLKVRLGPAKPQDVPCGSQCQAAAQVVRQWQKQAAKATALTLFQLSGTSVGSDKQSNKLGMTALPALRAAIFLSLCLVHYSLKTFVTAIQLIQWLSVTSNTIEER